MRAGFYETEITPPLGTGIPGYFYIRKSTGVKQKLYAKAAVVESGDKCVAFVVLDTLSVPIGVDKIIKERVCSNLPIEPDAIMLSAIHSHTSTPVMPNRRIFDNENEVEINKIIERIGISAADAVALAYQRLQTVNAYYAKGCVEGISFIRQYLLNNGEIRTNPGQFKEMVVKHCGESDKELPIILFKNEEGKPIGSITSFALHHDTVFGTDYSSDYSGMVAAKLKEEFGSDYVSLFCNGFSGDINHFDYCNKEGHNLIKTPMIAETITKQWLEAIKKAEKLEDTISFKVDFATVDKRKVSKEFVDSVKELVKNPPTSGDLNISDPYSDRQKYAASKVILQWYDQDKRTEIDIPVQVLKIGDCLIYALVGEQYSKFAYKIRNASPTEKNLMVSLAHAQEFSCYIPSPEMFLPHVYESTYYSARYEPDSGDRMADKAIEIAKDIY